MLNKLWWSWNLSKVLEMSGNYVLGISSSTLWIIIVLLGKSRSTSPIVFVRCFFTWFGLMKSVRGNRAKLLSRVAPNVVTKYSCQNMFSSDSGLMFQTCVLAFVCCFSICLLLPCPIPPTSSPSPHSICTPPFDFAATCPISWLQCILQVIMSL